MDATPSHPRGQSALDRLHDAHERAHPDEPGTLEEQIEALNLFWADPSRKSDPAGAWAIARRLAIPHARRARG